MQRHLARNGIRTHITGVDISEKTYQAALDNLDRYIHSDVLDIRTEPKYDCLILANVLRLSSKDHKIRILKKCRDLLNTNGLFVGTLSLPKKDLEYSRVPKPARPMPPDIDTKTALGYKLITSSDVRAAYRGGLATIIEDYETACLLYTSPSPRD